MQPRLPKLLSFPFRFSKSAITVVLREQLGNQLFQWAAGYSLAKSLGVPLHLYTANYGRTGHYLFLNRYDISAKFLPSLPSLIARKISGRDPYRDFRFSDRLGDGGIRSSKEPLDSHFLPEIFALPPGSLLDGMFQSWRYFPDLRDDLRGELTLRKDRISMPPSLLDPLQSSNAVAVHVRRGDYLAGGNREIFDVCGSLYFSRAVESIREAVADPTFFVFSDDIDWCRSAFHYSDFVFCSGAERIEGPLVDFELMRRCRHHIISNSTFSWWAAYLANHPDQIVICPDRWNRDGRSPISDKLLPGWVSVATT